MTIPEIVTNILELQDKLAQELRALSPGERADLFYPKPGSRWTGMDKDIDAMCYSAAEIIDICEGTETPHRRSKRTKIRKALGYTVPTR